MSLRLKNYKNVLRNVMERWRTMKAKIKVARRTERKPKNSQILLKS